MGSILRENIIYINEEEIEDTIKILKEKEYNIYATTLEESCLLEDVDLSKKSVFIFGNEANGVSDKLKNLSDKNIKIDMSNNTDSLNVSVAAGILMYKKYILKK